MLGTLKKFSLRSLTKPWGESSPARKPSGGVRGDMVVSQRKGEYPPVNLPKGVWICLGSSCKGSCPVLRAWTSASILNRSALASQCDCTYFHIGSVIWRCNQNSTSIGVTPH